eukprot:2664914-Lingulodinium_polyedra.AAC.2
MASPVHTDDVHCCSFLSALMRTLVSMSMHCCSFLSALIQTSVSMSMPMSMPMFFFLTHHTRHLGTAFAVQAPPRLQLGGWHGLITHPDIQPS